MYWLSLLSHSFGLLHRILDRPSLCIGYHCYHIIVDYSTGYSTNHLCFLAIVTVTPVWTTPLGGVRVFPLASDLTIVTSMWTTPLGGVRVVPFTSVLVTSHPLWTMLLDVGQTFPVHMCLLLGGAITSHLEVHFTLSLCSKRTETQVTLCTHLAYSPLFLKTPT